MTRRRQATQTRVPAYQHFFFVAAVALQLDVRRGQHSARDHASSPGLRRAAAMLQQHLQSPDDFAKA
jgi:hypothetical protein